MNRTQIEQRIAALNALQQSILAKLAAGEITDELTAQDKANQTELNSLSDKLATIKDAEGRLKQFSAAKPESNGELKALGVTVKDNSEDKPFKGAGEFLHAVASAELTGIRDPRLHKFAIGQSNAVDSEGGFLVGTDVASEIWRHVYDQSNIASRCMPCPVGANSSAYEIPVLEETSRATGSRNGGARAYWTGEAATITNSIVKVGKVRIEVEKLAALMYATNENLADASQLAGLLTNFAADEMSWVLDDAIINGDGAGKPLGVLSSPALVTTAAEGGQASGTINFANVTNMWGNLLPHAKQRGAWYIHSTAFPQLMRMASAATSASELVYLPPGGISQAPYGTLFGRPVYEIEQAQPLGSVGDIMFCDFGCYALARKGGPNVDSSIHVRFLTDETAFRVTMRVNGRPIHKAAITNAKGNATRSAFVALAAR